MATSGMHNENASEVKCSICYTKVARPVSCVNCDVLQFHPSCFKTREVEDRYLDAEDTTLAQENIILRKLLNEME